MSHGKKRNGGGEGPFRDGYSHRFAEGTRRGCDIVDVITFKAEVHVKWE